MGAESQEVKYLKQTSEVLLIKLLKEDFLKKLNRLFRTNSVPAVTKSRDLRVITTLKGKLKRD